MPSKPAKGRKRKTVSFDDHKVDDKGAEDAAPKKQRKESPLKVKPFIFEKDQYPEIAADRKNMELYNIPSFPATALFIGGAGSGKTSTLAMLMTEKSAYGGDLQESGLKPFFKPKDVFLFGTSMDSDPTWVEVRKQLKIPDENVYVDMEEKDLKDVLDEMQKNGEKFKDKLHCPRSLLVYDDAIADTELMMSDSVMKSAIKNRHMCCNVWFSSQSLKKAPRIVRLQAQAICYWAGNATREDQEKVFEEWGSGGMSKKEWFSFIMPHFNDKHTFLYINRNLPPLDRYRVNFDEVIEWKHIDDAFTQKAKAELGAPGDEKQEEHTTKEQSQPKDESGNKPAVP